MVYHDNVAYGFARNLLVLRPLGIGVTLISILLNITLLYSYFILAGQSLINFVGNHMAMIIFGSGAIIASLILLWIFAVIVNDSYVKGRAVRYAKSLLAVCETPS